MRKLFLTVFYSGLSPKAPGTAGSIVSLLIAMFLLNFLSLTTLFLLTLLITVVAVKQINLYEEEVGEHDSKEIVVDELAGMWLALCISGATIANITASNVIEINWITAILAFIYFRLFDIYKPSIIGRIDENVQGGWGVMGDDIVAGFFAGLCTSITYFLLF